MEKMEHMTQRAYSLFEVKSLDEPQRRFRGWATTPSLDRMNDTIDPMGATFANPLPLLHQHRHDAPIGLVQFSPPTIKGIEFEAHIPTITEAGPLKDRVDTAWGEIRHGLVRAVSIGFRAIDYDWKDDGGIEFKKIEIYELSSVTIPALPDAVITEVKTMRTGRLPQAVIAQIKLLDYGTRKQGPVHLVTPKPTHENLNGAVRLSTRVPPAHCSIPFLNLSIAAFGRFFIEEIHYENLCRTNRGAQSHPPGKV